MFETNADKRSKALYLFYIRSALQSRSDHVESGKEFCDLCSYMIRDVIIFQPTNDTFTFLMAI